MTGTTLRVTAQAGEANALTISAGLTVVDNGVTLITGAAASEIVVDLGDGEPLVIDLDDQRDDGARGEADNVRASVDVVVGGAANDRITGSDGENDLDGGAGNDRLQGGAGNDRLNGGSEPDELDGGAGRDRLWAKDSRREAVRCGPGKDRASTDSTDMLFRCERARAGAATRRR